MKALIHFPEGACIMDASLNLFLRQLLRAVIVALIPVVLVSFCSIPYTLQGHPGEPRVDAISRHMT
jgi:hypothetical protein